MKKCMLILAMVVGTFFTTTGTAHAVSSAGWWNPANCILLVDAPHKSTHVRGTINGTVVVSCSGSVSNLKIRARMWEQRWWGYQIITEKYVGASNSTSYMAVQVPVLCRNNSMRVTGQESYTTKGGTWVSPVLSETRYVSC